jgi:hypothetical protein
MRSHSHRLPAPAVEGYELDSDAGWLAVILAKGATNLVPNPSVELDLTGYTANAGGALSRVATEQHNGAWGIKYIPTAATNDGVWYAGVNLVAGTRYFASWWFKGQAGLKYVLRMADTGFAFIGSPAAFVATGRWQRVVLTVQPTVSGTYYVYCMKNGQANLTPFYLDSLQVEANQLTTYLDGDMKGLLQNRADFYWTGVAHASTSVRIEQCRAGGILMPLKQLGFHLLAIIGLSMSPVRDSVNSMARGGAQFQDTTLDVRPFTITGFIEGDSPQDLGRFRQGLIDAFKPDAVSPSQPVTLQYQLTDCGQPIGDAVNIVCNYQDGLRGAITNNNRESLGIQFNMYLPLLVSDAELGSSLAYQTTFSVTNVIARIGGNWSPLGTGANSSVNVVKADPATGRIYMGGAFILFNGVAANRIGYWDPILLTFVPLGTGVNAIVRDIAIAPNHDVWIIGDFTTAGGAATKGIARWNYATSTWSVFTPSTVALGALNAIVIDNLGRLYLGGQFTFWNADASANYIVRYDPATGTWASIGGGGLNAPVYSLAVDVNGQRIYIGGNFTTPFVRLMMYDPSTNAFTQPVKDQDGIVRTIAIRGDAFKVIGGDFLTPTAYIGDVDGHTLGSGVNNIVRKLAWKGEDLYAVGDFVTAGGLAINDHVAVFHGNTWTPLDVDLPGSPSVLGVDFLGDDIYIGFSGAGTATTAAGYTVINNTGSSEAYPRFTMTGPATIVSIRNITTGAALYFDLTLLPGETVVLEIRSDRITFTSSWRGIILGTIIPGSNTAGFILAPGLNNISVSYSGTVSAATLFTIVWRPSHHGIDSLIPGRIIH